MRRLVVLAVVLVLGAACSKSSSSNSQVSFVLHGTIISATTRASVPTVTNAPAVTAPGAPSTDGSISLQTTGSAPSGIARCRPSAAGAFAIFFDRKTTFSPASIVASATFPASLANHTTTITGHASVPSTTVNGNGCVLIADTIQIGNAVPSGTNGPQKTLLPAPTAFPGQGTPAPTTAAGSTPSLSGAPAPLPGD